MMKLNPNQKINRASLIMSAVRKITDPLHRDDREDIWKHVTTALGFVKEKPETPVDQSNIGEKILRAIENGLESNDAQMVRAAMDWKDEHEGREFLRELVVNIVPYEIADKSLRNIVLEAGDDVIVEIELALAERAARAK